MYIFPGEKYNVDRRFSLNAERRGGCDGDDTEKPEGIFLCMHNIHSVNTHCERCCQIYSGAGGLGPLLHDRSAMYHLFFSGTLFWESPREEGIDLRSDVFGDLSAYIVGVPNAGILNGDRNRHRYDQILAPGICREHRRDGRS